jgi:hypothetical protein
MSLILTSMRSRRFSKIFFWEIVQLMINVYKMPVIRTGRLPHCTDDLISCCSMRWSVALGMQHLIRSGVSCIPSATDHQIDDPFNRT